MGKTLQSWSPTDQDCIASGRKSPRPRGQETLGSTSIEVHAMCKDHQTKALVRVSSHGWVICLADPCKALTWRGQQRTKTAVAQLCTVIKPSFLTAGPGCLVAAGQAHLVVCLEDHTDSTVGSLLGHELIELLFSLKVRGSVLPQLAQRFGPSLCLLSLFLGGQLFRSL